ncbi:MAG TPA: hypothetical protein PK209_08770 [Saprospiraceae bacterium]|nr:hypothetical protein [Saprospiraceae bacterium]
MNCFKSDWFCIHRSFNLDFNPVLRPDFKDWLKDTWKGKCLIGLFKHRAISYG